MAADALSQGAQSRAPASTPDRIIGAIERYHTARCAEDEAWVAMTDLRATTIAGAAAYAAYACEYTGLRDECEDGIPFALTALRDMLALMAAGEARAAAHLPDATLLALGQKLEAAWAHERAIAVATAKDADWGDEGSPVERAIARTGKIVDDILLLRATSLAGAEVKARAVLWCHSGDIAQLAQQGESVSDKLAYSLALDMLGDHTAAPEPAEAA